MTRLQVVLITVASLMLLAVVGAVTWVLASGSDPDVESAQDVADMVGCADYVLADTVTFFVTERGTCFLNGAEVEVYYFASTEARDNHLRLITESGNEVLLGDQWAVDADKLVLKQIQDDVGGDLEP